MSENASPRSIGRPSNYTEEAASVICELISEGHSLKEICTFDGMPYRSTVFRWLAAHETFRDMYARAREDQQDALVDETIQIADTEPDPQRARVRIWARQWHAAKLRPRKYGDRIDVNPDEDRPMNVSTSAKDDTTRAKAMAALLARRRANSNG